MHAAKQNAEVNGSHPFAHVLCITAASRQIVCCSVSELCNTCSAIFACAHHMHARSNDLPMQACCAMTLSSMAVHGLGC